MKSALKRVLLVSILIVPVLIYLLFVYSAKEVFFKTLDYFGPVEIIQKKDESGNIYFDTLKYKMPFFEGISHYGYPINRDSVMGKISVVNFFFTNCPSICGPMNFHVKERIYDRFKGFENFQILSFTVDPERDTIEALKAYAIKMGIKSDDIRHTWKFITGDRDQIYDLAEGLFLNAMEDETAPGGFLHSELLVLVDWDGLLRCRRDEHGNLVGAYSSLDQMSLKEIQEDISVLIAEYEKLESLKRKKQKKT